MEFRAQRQKIIVPAHLLELQHLGPDGGKLLLQLRAWRFAGRCCGLNALGRRQRRAVDLAIGRDGQTVEPHPRRRDHVFGQVLRQKRTQGLGLFRLAWMLHPVGCQPRVAGRILAQDHGSIGDMPLGPQHRLDFAQLNTKAAQLHLMINTAEDQRFS